MMKPQASGEEKKYDAIYVNSYTQRISGNDCKYIIDLGRPFTFSEISLTTCILENRFMNLYKSYDKDFSDLTIEVQGIGIIPIRATQYYYNFTILQNWLNSLQPILGFNGVFTITQRNDWSSTLRVALTVNGVNTNFRCIGLGWEKLGFVTIRNDVLSTPKLFPSSYDLSQPSAYLVCIRNIKSQISNGRGVASFLVANNGAFDGKIVYQNQQKNTSQTIYLNTSITLQYLEIEIQNCDQTVAETIQAFNPTTNMIGTENIFCFNIR